jgi:hypothetical protein
MTEPRIGNNPEKSDIAAAINHLGHVIEHQMGAIEKITVQQHPALRQRAMELLRKTRELQKDFAKELLQFPEALVINRGVEHRISAASQGYWVCSCGWQGKSEQEFDDHVVAAVGH